MVTKRLHRWDRSIVLRALIIGATIEGIAIAPAAISPWGHAGPEWLLGWVSILLNLPGIFVVRLLRSGDESFAVIIAAVFIVQTVILSYLAFVYLRWRKLSVKVQSLGISQAR